jgi:cytochrome c-type biogenesis protein CcmH
LRERTSIEQGTTAGRGEKKWLKSTLLSWFSVLALGALVTVSLISSLSPPRGPQRVGEANLAINSDPDPPRLGLNRLRVRLTAADGTPLSDAGVEMKYGVEGMGTLTVTTPQPAGQGVYESAVEFDRPGPWQVILTLKRQGGADSTTTYVYNVAPSSGGGMALTGTVRIRPGLTGKIRPGDVLFVIARRGPGPPLAAKRIPNPSFPVSFRLGPEDMVMASGSFEGEVSVVARIRKGGAAGPAQPGDLEGAYERNPVKIGVAPIEIVIDREL